MSGWRVTVRVDFCYGHRLLDYDGACAHPHGHNGLAEITLESDSLDHRGMVMDFGDVKREMKGWIDRTMDHRMLVREDDPMVEWLEASGEPHMTLEENPTAETIARLIYDRAEEFGHPVVEVRLWETPSSFATYRG